LDEFDDPEEAHARRGAPHTFNVAKYVTLVKSLKDHPYELLHAPSFDHGVKGPLASLVSNTDPVEDAILILPEHKIILVEGNYVLLTVPRWDEATSLLDEKWFVKVNYEDARSRVVRRHLQAGIASTETEAMERFEKNDWPNGVYTLKNSDVQKADKIINSTHEEI
jgi:pantothenate kinase